MNDSNFHFVVGDDDFLVRQRAQEIFDSLSQAFPDDLSREIIDGRADRVEEAERMLSETKMAAQTVSLFGGGKLVWLNEANFLNLGKTGASQSCKTALETIKPVLENLSDSKVLISACPVHRNHGFIKWAQGVSQYEDVSKNEKEDQAFRRLIEETAVHLGVSFERGAAECLSAKIGSHPRLGVEEVRKLSCFLGTDGNEISVDLVMEMVPEFGEGDFFEASEAFFSGDLSWAVDSIERHFFQGKDARPLLSTLQNRNRLLIQLRVLADGGEIVPSDRLSKSDLQELSLKYGRFFGDESDKSSLNLFSQNPWFLGRLLPLVAKFSARRLIDLQSFFLETFQEILAQPKELHSQIFKNLVLRAHAK